MGDDLDTFVQQHPAVKAVNAAAPPSDDLDAFVAQHPAVTKLNAPNTSEWTGSRGVIPPTPAPSWSDLPGNIPGSFGHLVGGIANAVTHPLDTVKGVAGIGLGALERGASKIGPIVAPPTPGMDQSSPEAQADYETHGRLFDSFKQMLSDRYGSLENAKRTAITDPVGFVADVATAAQGASGALGLASDSATAAGATRLARSLAATADTTRNISEWVDPVQNVIRAAKPLAKVVGKAGAAALGTSTGAGMGAVEQAYEGSKTFKDYMRGKADAQDLLTNVRNAFQDLKDKRSTEYRGQLAALPQSTTVDLSQLKQDMPAMLKGFGVKFGTQGKKVKLDFSRSTISNLPEQAKVNAIVQDVYDWGSKPGDLSPLGVDTLKRRVGDFYSDSGQARAFVKQIEGAVKDKLNKVPGYEQMTKDYAVSSDMLQQVEKELALKNPNPGVSLNRLSTSFRRSTEFRKALLDSLHNTVGGIDFNAARAGLNFNKYVPEGLRGIFDLAAMIGDFSTHGVGAASHVAYLGLTSPRLVGETLVLLNNLQKGLTPVGRLMRQPVVYRGAQIGNTAQRAVQQGPPYADDDEAGIGQVMADHSMTREQAIDALKQRGHIQ